MSVTIWNRLEARPRSLNVDRALRAEIRDPLWLLSRQWQFGEFLASDAGSAILSRVRYQQAALAQVQLGKATPEPYSDRYPLEALVEKQATPLDLDLRLEMGRHWLRLLKKGLPAADGASAVTAFRADPRWHFHLPAAVEPDAKIDQAQLLANPSLLRRISAVAKGRMLDGGALYFYLKANPAHRASDFLPAPQPAIDTLGNQFIEWFEKVYGQDQLAKNAWQPEHLEYGFSVSIVEPDGIQRKLSGAAHNGGPLDWHQFDYDGGMDGDATASADPQVYSKVFIPNAATYPGMPVARYWEMEDQRINFGNIEAGTTDTAKLVFAQFGLLYGNDWLCIPLELPVGHLHRISELEVTDVFGQRVRIPHVHQGGQNEFWGFFQMHDARQAIGQQNDGGLWLPPVVSRAQQGEPQEKVIFIRDEMANMVWAIENTIPDGSGGGMDGFEQAQRVRAFIAAQAPEDRPELQENEAQLRYKLVSEVADNWIPFLPVKIEGSIRDIQLQRAAMPRVIPGHATRRIRPQSSILQAGGFQSPYYVFEEEVPRAGAVVTQQWNRCRWHDGSVVVWLSRTKTNGRGEQSSGLRYDYLEDR